MDGADSTVDSRTSAAGPRAALVQARPLLLLALFAFLATFAIDRLWLLYSHKFFDVTGQAQWIFVRHRLASHDPAAFFATREFDLPPNRAFTKIKIAGDPEYTLWFNGTEIGGRRAGESRALDVFDVSQLARTQANRMVVAVRSADGVGGLLVGVDVAQEFQNAIVSDGSWHIVRRWFDDLVVHDPPPQFISAPMLLGRPPAGRWNYLGRQEGLPAQRVSRVIAPRAAFTFKTSVPIVQVIEGTAVARTHPTIATAYDFGPTAGRVRLVLPAAAVAAHVVNVRFANDRGELLSIEGPVEPFVFAAGERSVINPEQRRFRYVMVYGSEAAAEVLQ